MGQVEPGREANADDQDDEPARYARCVAFDPEKQCQGKQPDSQRREAGVAQVGDQVGQLTDAVATAFRQTKELGKLADGHEYGQAEHEAFHYRAGQERGDEPQLAYPRKHQEKSRYKDHAGRQGGVAVHAFGAESRRGDGGKDEHSRRRGGGHDQVARRPENGIEGEGREQRIKAGLRRQPGQAGVRDHFRDEQSPDGETGYGVIRQPRTLVFR